MKLWVPSALIVIRADSGFAVPGLFELAETKGHKYVIRLKSNARLQSIAQTMANPLLTSDRLHKREVHYREFMYQASSWERARRVVVNGAPCGRTVVSVHLRRDQHDQKEFIQTLSNLTRLPRFG